LIRSVSCMLNFRFELLGAVHPDPGDAQNPYDTHGIVVLTDPSLLVSLAPRLEGRRK
jgi:hypothetical protein